MTSFRPSDPAEACPKCGGPVSERPAAPYPVLSQVLFALSFVGFLAFFDRVRDQRWIVWAWSAVQILLGVILVRGRMRASKRLSRCIRCGADLR